MTARLRLANGLMRTSARLGWAEPELRGLGELVRAGDTVYDIGAAYGMYTLPLAALVGPGGRVFAFEPQPRQSDTTWTITRLVGAPQATVTRAVAGNREAEVTLRVPLKLGIFPIYGHAHGRRRRRSGTGARQGPAHRHAHGRGGCVVEAPSRTGVVPEGRRRGFEPSVLEGARATIDRDRPSLLLEIEDRHLRRYGDDGNAFADRIRHDWPEYRMYTRARDRLGADRAGRSRHAELPVRDRPRLRTYSGRMSEPSVPDFRVIRGNPTPAELAAVTAVLTAVLEDETAAEELAGQERRSAWELSQRGLRGDLGTAGWRSFSG